MAVYKRDMGDHFLILTDDDPNPVPVPKSELASNPEAMNTIMGLPDMPSAGGAPGAGAAPVGAPLPPTAPIAPAPNMGGASRAGVSASGGIQAPKFSGANLKPMAEELGSYGKQLENIGGSTAAPVPIAPGIDMQLPENLSPTMTAEGGMDFRSGAPKTLEDVRREATQEGGSRVFPGDLAFRESKLRALDLEREEADKRRQEMVDVQEQQLQELQNDVKNYKISSDYVFGARPTGKKDKQGKEIMEGGDAGSMVQAVGLILGAALQSYASGLLGRDPGAGIQTISNFMDRRMDEQKAELARRRDLAANQVNFLGEMRSRYRDERAAELAVRNVMMEDIKTKMADIQGRVDDAQKQEFLENARIGLTQQQEQNALRAKQLELDARAKLDEQAWRRDMLAAQRSQQGLKIKELAVPGMSFSGERLPTDKDADLVNKARGKVANVINNINILHKQVFDPQTGVGTEVFPTKQANLAKSRLRDIQLDLKSEPMKNLGVLTGPDLELLEDITSRDITGVFTEENKLLLEDLRNRVLNGFIAQSRQHGYIENELGQANTFTPSR